MINLRVTLNRLRKLIPILVLFVTACAQTGEPEKSILNLEVGVDYEYGGVQPVARQEFYLLDADLNELLGGTAGETSKKRLWQLTSFVDGSWGQEADKNRADLTEMIRTHTIAKATTDLHGKLSFGPVVPGVYYILGWSTTRTEHQLMIWNYRADLKPGMQNASLSSSDAATIANWLPWPSRQQ
jgi:hypothetical protein